MAEKLGIPLPEITCEDFQAGWIRFELVAAAKEWTPEKQALILPTLLRGKLVECYVDLDTETKKDAKSVKDELVKRLRLCRDPLEAGRLFMARSQLEHEKVTEYAMFLKKLFQQAYSEESCTSGILLQRFVMGLKTPIGKQLLLRGKLGTLENTIDAAREIECVLELGAKPVEAKVGVVDELQNNGDTGIHVALKELTERLGNLEAKIQSVVQRSDGASSDRARTWEPRSTGREQERRPERPAEDNHKRRMCYFCGQDGHIKRYCPLNFKGLAGQVNGGRPGNR